MNEPWNRPRDILDPNCQEQIIKDGEEARLMASMTKEEWEAIQIREWTELDELMYQMGVWG